MTVLDRHVLREWLKVFGLVLGATLGLFVIADLTTTLAKFLEHDATTGDILYYELISSLAAIPLVLPIAVLVSLLYALGQLHRNNEFVAMRAAGLGVFRIVRTIVAAGLLFTGAMWYLNDSLIPWSVEEARNVEDRIKLASTATRRGAAPAAVIPTIAFDNARGGRLWFINRFDVQARTAFGVTVSVVDRARREQRRLLAAEAFYLPDRRGWMFLRGREYSFDPANGELRTPIVLFDEKFEAGFSEDTGLMLLLRKDADDLSLFELRRVIDHLRVEGSPRLTTYEVELARKHSSPFGVLVVMALAVPFAMSGVRTNPAVGVSKSLGFFFAFYLLNSLGRALGTRGTLDADLAAWLPYGIALVVAAWAFRRVE